MSFTDEQKRNFMRRVERYRVNKWLEANPEITEALKNFTKELNRISSEFDKRLKQQPADSKMESEDEKTP